MRWFIFRELIDIVEKRGGEESKPVWVGYAFSVVLFVLYLLRTIFIHCAFNHMIMMGISAKTSLIGAIYRKVLTHPVPTHGKEKNEQPHPGCLLATRRSLTSL